MDEVLRQHIEKLLPLTDEEFAFVLSHFTVESYKKHDFLIEKGKSVRHNYFVISGLLKLVHNDELGKEHIVSFAMEDWWESDYFAFYNGGKASMSLQCLEDTQVFCITLEAYNNLCAGLPKIEHFLLIKGTGGHIAAQQRILSFLTSNAKERYDQFVRKYPLLFQRVSKTLIASYLGVSRETLSRLSS
ncbi:Crp/Fnr family transcriptional regulator [Flavobacterium zepuense]|uniref:Crp/Fnr family transcriptional regulator n=1 Tax=Flavobacterium zepuense TaxID=2593302 RepID=A0A552V885_9FLAO|nr:Crp/Fnr family transcriptional regulator [Flavobacterium zepuense]TRW26681.1 Crp/Fnr family transcriptional regulator [Flavobacterium zepuense]